MVNIKYLVMDVDGTLTDGKIYVGSNGELFKVFDIRDGCGIHDILIPNGIEPIIITGRKSEILKTRCMELGITELYQGISDKLEALDKIIGRENYKRTAYIGDDINDRDCMLAIKNGGGLLGCPNNANDEIKKISPIFRCKKNGGDGAVREFIEWIIEQSASI